MTRRAIDAHNLNKALGVDGRNQVVQCALP
jgi:hypothetical protein